MANNFIWKDQYYDSAGTIILESDLIFYSPLGSADGAGSRNLPILSKEISPIDMTNCILPKGNISFNTQIKSRGFVFIGQGAGLTEISVNVLYPKGNATMVFKDLTMSKILGPLNLVNNVQMYDCVIATDPKRYIYNLERCLITCDVNIDRTPGINISFKNVNVNPSLQFYCKNSVFENCMITLSSTEISYFSNTYFAFDNCKFKIDGETEFKALAGNTAEDLRNDFVARCTAQSINVPVITERDEILPAGRWIFTKKSTVGGKIIANSEVDKFQKRRSIKLGWSEKTIDILPITTKANLPQSVSPSFPNSENIGISENSISIPKQTDITNPLDAYVTSNVFWLGGKYKLNDIDVFNNLQAQYGILIDSQKALDSNKISAGEGKIEAGVHYLVRSSNKQPASISYNGEVYTTSLSTRNNVFVGVAGITSFTTVSGVPAVYKVLDTAMLSTIQVRIVDKLPAGNITTGNLQASYWYFVEPNNFGDTSGTITYKGVEYPSLSSFLVDSSALTFTVKGSCHLRRCWRDDYKKDTEVTDKTFWQDIQKPQWINVVPNDMRCFMKLNNQDSGEMLASGDTYVTTGHPDFYSNMSGAAGFYLPDYPIIGSFMQLRIDISTLNPI